MRKLMSEKPSRKSFRLRLDEMVDTLRDDIISGKLMVGKYLPSELELGKRFLLSNNSVRQGLQQLVNEGLIEKIARVGNRVSLPRSRPTITLNLGYHNTMQQDVELDELIAEFHKRYPHIQVRTVMINLNDSKTVQEYIEAGLLDVMTFNNHNFQQMEECGQTELLEPLEERPELYAFLSRPFCSEGKLLMQPLVFSPLILCYNKDHFREKRLTEPDSSWSWDDLFRCAEHLAIKNERFGFYFHLFARNRWPVFLLQSGMTFDPDEQGRYRLCGTRLMDSLDICRDLIYRPNVFPTILSASDADAEQLFLQQRVSIIMTTYFGLNELKSAGFAYDLAPLPYFHEYRTLLTIIGLSISRRSKEKEAAKMLVDFLVSHEAQSLIRQTTLSIPASKSAAERKSKDMLNRPSRFHMYRDIIPTFQLPSDLKLSTSQMNLLLEEVKIYWSGLQTKGKMCQRLEKDLAERRTTFAE